MCRQDVTGDFFVPCSLGFCTRCGRPVATYTPGNTDFLDEFESRENEPHYWCSFWAERLLAINTFDTGTVCQKCNAFMPLYAKYCGSCGNGLRLEEAD